MVTPPRILFELRARAAGGRSGIPSSCRPVCKVEKRLRGWFPVIVATGGGAMGGAGGTAFLEPFLVDKWRVVLEDMRRANFLGDRRFLDLVGIMLL